MLDRVSQLALIAAGQAIADSRLNFASESRDRCGVSVGTSMGGVITTDEAYYSLYGERSERVQPFHVLSAMNNAAAAWIGIDHGLTGPNLTYSTACSSSAVALGEAASRIRCGEADVMLAGGAEAPLTFGVLRAWEAMRTLATTDPDRSRNLVPPVFPESQRTGDRRRLGLHGPRRMAARACPWRPYPRRVFWLWSYQRCDSHHTAHR